MKEVTSSTFSDAVLRQKGLVLVDFWATWCAPCRMLAPVLEQCATMYSEQLEIVKVDADTSEDLLVQYGVRGLPTLLLFKGGEVVDQRVGAGTLSDITAFLSPYVSND